MTYLGTDEAKIIEVMAKHTNQQRQEIALSFKTQYGKVSHLKRVFIILMFARYDTFRPPRCWPARCCLLGNITFHNLKKQTNRHFSCLLYEKILLFLVENQKLNNILHSQELKAELKSELGGKFEDVVLGLLEKPIDYDAIQLKEAVKVHMP